MKEKRKDGWKEKRESIRDREIEGIKPTEKVISLFSIIIIN